MFVFVRFSNLYLVLYSHHPILCVHVLPYIAVTTQTPHDLKTHWIYMRHVTQDPVEMKIPVKLTTGKHTIQVKALLNSESNDNFID